MRSVRAPSEISKHSADGSRPVVITGMKVALSSDDVVLGVVSAFN